MAYEQRDMSGTFFPNTYKEAGDNKPCFKGKCMVRREMLELAAWEKISQNGVVYYSFALSEPQERNNRDEFPQAGNPDEGLGPQQAAPNDNLPEDGLPF